MTALCLTAICATDFASAADRQKQVLALYSSRRDAQISIVGDREMQRVLDNGLGGLDYYSEFIDRMRYYEGDYQAAFREFLRLKYEGHKFDLVIAMDRDALDIVTNNRVELFPNTPVVFFSDSPSTRRPANSAGLISELDLHGTLALATELQPDLQHVFVINGNGDSEYEKAARAQFRPFEPRLTFTYLSGLRTKDLEARLATLPEHSMIYYLVVGRDGADENFHPLDYITRIVSVANAPTYSWVDSAMGRGIVGGSLKSQSAQAEGVAMLALRVLRGEPADSIPIMTPALNVTQVDWRQLRRWGISEARIPAGTLIRFRERSVWDRFKFYILGAVALLLAQTLLIGGLLVQRSSRRKAEEHLRASQTKLRASHDQISDLGGRLLLAQEAERSRIARELHDDVGQQIALIVADLEAASGFSRAASHDSEESALKALDRVHGLARSVHDLSHRLHPAKLRLLGLTSALESLQQDLSRPGVAISITHENIPPALDYDLTVCVFRVVQEAVQNAIKHGNAHEILVHLAGGDRSLTVTIVDDGSGFDVNARFGKGLGLISMNERLEAIGGSLRIHSKPAGGTRLKISVPYKDEQRPEVVAV